MKWLRATETPFETLGLRMAGVSRLTRDWGIPEIIDRGNRSQYHKNGN